MVFRSINEPLIKCTRREVEFLHGEVRRAIRECSDLEFQRLRRNKDSFWSYRVVLEVHGRNSDGSISAQVVCAVVGRKKRYVRKLRTTPSKHSLGELGRELRLARHPSYFKAQAGKREPRRGSSYPAAHLLKEVSNLDARR